LWTVIIIIIKAKQSNFSNPAVYYVKLSILYAKSLIELTDLTSFAYFFFIIPNLQNYKVRVGCCGI